MAEDKDHIELGHSYTTTRRKFELMRVDEIHRATNFVIREVDEAMAMIKDAWVEDGECEIVITVKQRMRKKVTRKKYASIPTVADWADVHAHHLLDSEIAAYQSMRARGFSHEDAREAALDGVDVKTLREEKPKP